MVRGRQQRGFTLLEVLVAFVIAAMSLAVMYQIYAHGAASAILGKEYAEAVAIAESRLAELGITKPLDQMETVGIVADKYRWELNFRDPEPDPEQSFDPQLLLQEIELTLSWDSRGGRRTLRFHTLRPANSP